MKLLENQTYKKKISFVKSSDNDQTLSFVICVQCNHDIDKSILNNIEETINAMFLNDYESSEDVMELKLHKKELEKHAKELEKQTKEHQKILENESKKQQLEFIKQNKDYLKILEKESNNQQHINQPQKQKSTNTKCKQYNSSGKQFMNKGAHFNF
jgi:hypothetical protein